MYKFGQRSWAIHNDTTVNINMFAMQIKNYQFKTNKLPI